MISVSLLVRRQLDGQHTIWCRRPDTIQPGLKSLVSRRQSSLFFNYFSIGEYLSAVERRILRLRRDSAPAAVGSQIKIKNMPAVRVITNAFARRKCPDTANWNCCFHPLLRCVQNFLTFCSRVRYMMIPRILGALQRAPHPHCRRLRGVSMGSRIVCRISRASGTNVAWDDCGVTLLRKGPPCPE